MVVMSIEDNLFSATTSLRKEPQTSDQRIKPHFSHSHDFKVGTFFKIKSHGKQFLLRSYHGDELWFFPIRKQTTQKTKMKT